MSYRKGKINVNSLQIVPTMMKTSLDTKKLFEEQTTAESRKVIEDQICENLMLFCNYTNKILIENSKTFL